MSLDLSRAHPRVAGDLWLILESLLLAFARGDDTLTDLRRFFSTVIAGNLAELNRRHFDVQIDTIQQRTGDATEVMSDLTWCAARFCRHFAVRRRIHSSDQHELRREGHSPSRTG